eukprot:m.132586 g.132586  ORF g.132586 m.132586 type:complete len:852 (-) comp29619_c0_seq1:45-2600(-)
MRRLDVLRLVCSTAFATSAISEIAPPPNICAQNASIGQAVISAVNLSWPGMEAVKSAATANDLGAACEALATYYKNGKTSEWLRLPVIPVPSARRAGGDADDLVDHDIFHLSGVGQVAKIPRNADGGIDWLDKGPKNDPEFMNCLNRHDSFTHLLLAWNSTGNPIYSTYFSALVEDWTGHLPCRKGVSRTGWDAPGGAEPCATGTMESPWRVLESGIRPAGPWPPAFFGMQQAPEFTTSARVMMVLGFSEHNAVLNGPGRSATTPNWAIGQWAGLVESCVALPELKNCSGLVETAFMELEFWLDQQVYPDGVETEEAFGYDMWTAASFFDTIALLQQAHHSPPPQSYLSKVEQMYNYGTYANDQMGYSPRDGDMDLGKSGWKQSATDYFKRADWTYVHTGGTQGIKPTGVSASTMFPYGGQAIFRNHYEATDDALWMWMDVGPYGSSGHAHASKNAINLRAFGSMLLVDSGRFQYNGDGLSEKLNREYERTTTAHNSLTFDGCEQQYEPALAKGPVASSSWSFGPDSDFVSGVSTLYTGIDGDVAHQRGTLLIKKSANNFPPYIVVVDKVTTDRARTVQASWHAHPNAKVSLSSGGGHKATIVGAHIATAQPSSTMLTVVPSEGPHVWTSSQVIRGQIGNSSAGIPWQGWYSANYNGNSTAPALVYDGEVPATGAVFGWLFVPQNDSSMGTPKAALSIYASDNTGVVKATVSINGKKENVTLDLGPAPAPPPPCAANEARICGTCKALSLAPCPKGMKVDFVLASGDDGSCDCDEYCATDWSHTARSTRPHWTGAISALGNTSAQRCSSTGGGLMCVCVQATHFCPVIPHLCKSGCGTPGVPVATNYCIPA